MISRDVPIPPEPCWLGTHLGSIVRSRYRQVRPPRFYEECQSSPRRMSLSIQSYLPRFSFLRLRFANLGPVWRASSFRLHVPDSVHKCKSELLSGDRHGLLAPAALICRGVSKSSSNYHREPGGSPCSALAHVVYEIPARHRVAVVRQAQLPLSVFWLRRAPPSSQQTDDDGRKAPKKAQLML